MDGKWSLAYRTGNCLKSTSTYFMPSPWTAHIITSFYAWNFTHQTVWALNLKFLQAKVFHPFSHLKLVYDWFNGMAQELLERMKLASVTESLEALKILSALLFEEPDPWDYLLIHAFIHPFFNLGMTFLLLQTSLECPSLFNHFLHLWLTSQSKIITTSPFKMGCLPFVMHKILDV